MRVQNSGCHYSPKFTTVESKIFWLLVSMVWLGFLKVWRDRKPDPLNEGLKQLDKYLSGSLGDSNLTSLLPSPNISRNRLHSSQRSRVFELPFLSSIIHTNGNAIAWCTTPRGSTLNTVLLNFQSVQSMEITLNFSAIFMEIQVRWAISLPWYWANLKS